MLRAWHSHGNTLRGRANFYSLLAEVDQESMESKENWYNGDGWTLGVHANITEREKGERDGERTAL
jgi:hypothetical protein